MSNLRLTITCLLVGGWALLLGACAGIRSDPIASSGTSGCENANMGAIDMRNDPANGLQGLKH